MEFLSQQGIQFTAKNVAEDRLAREEVTRRTGRMSVPVIAVGDEVIIGFDRGRIAGLLGPT
jgi:glutaredoxin